MIKNNNKIRFFGNNPGQDLYAQYHDQEWGVPVYDDQRLFEFILLKDLIGALSKKLVCL